jgi:hypothetical protein
MASGFRFSGTLPSVAQAALQLLALHGPVQPSGLCRNPSFVLLASIRSTRLQPVRKVHAGSNLAEQRDQSSYAKSVAGLQGVFAQQFVVCVTEAFGVFEVTAKLIGLITPVMAAITSMQHKAMAINTVFDVILFPLRLVPLWICCF